jgi:hypothetical protein
MNNENEMTFTPEEILNTTKYEYQSVSIKVKPDDIKRTGNNEFTLTVDLEAEYTSPITVESTTLPD